MKSSGTGCVSLVHPLSITSSMSLTPLCGRIDGNRVLWISCNDAENIFWGGGRRPELFTDIAAVLNRFICGPVIVGMPSSVVGWLHVRRGRWSGRGATSFLAAASRLICMPCDSPSHPFIRASVMRSSRLWMISAMRPRLLGVHSQPRHEAEDLPEIEVNDGMPRSRAEPSPV